MMQLFLLAKKSLQNGFEFLYDGKQIPTFFSEGYFKQRNLTQHVTLQNGERRRDDRKKTNDEKSGSREQVNASRSSEDRRHRRHRDDGERRSEDKERHRRTRDEDEGREKKHRSHREREEEGGKSRRHRDGDVEKKHSKDEQVINCTALKGMYSDFHWMIHWSIRNCQYANNNK